jgi:predicted kinase
MDLEKLEKQNPAAYQHAMDIRQHAKEKTSNLRSMYERGRLGLIIDGTGRDYADIKEQYDAAHALGYDCYMVFINTTYETALARNRRRERSVKEELVSEFWQDCQKNLGKFQHLFGSANFLVVDSSDDRVKSHEVLRVMGKAIARWMSAPVKNHLGAKWIALMGGRHKH